MSDSDDGCDHQVDVRRSGGGDGKDRDDLGVLGVFVDRNQRCGFLFVLACPKILSASMFCLIKLCVFSFVNLDFGLSKAKPPW